MSLFKKIISASALVWLIFLPAAAVRAADVLAPELNPVCWEQKACEKARTALGGGAGKEGWLEKQDPCKKEGWGMCLPAGKTVTEISFGGNKNFANIGEFILTIYKYAVGVASILATIMIIISGTQWATSGGNAETINSAKKRIAGAVIGLFIALMSNFILTSINPALVNLRLPQTYMIRPQVLGSEFCDDMSTSTQFAFAAAMGATVDKNKLKDQQNWRTMDKIGVSEKQCGSQWFIKDGGGTSCVSSQCPGGETSIKVCQKSDPAKKIYGCSDGAVAGTIIGPYLVNPGCLTEIAVNLRGWKFPFVVSGGTAAQLFYVCGNGVFHAMAGGPVNEQSDGKTENFNIPLTIAQLNQSKATCEGNANAAGLKGYVVLFRFNNACWAKSNQSRFVGRGGVGFPNIAGQWSGQDFVSQNYSSIPYDNMIQFDEMKKGINLTIDVTNITPE
jgi:hypothetical protein